MLVLLLVVVVAVPALTFVPVAVLLLAEAEEEVWVGTGLSLNGIAKKASNSLLRAPIMVARFSTFGASDAGVGIGQGMYPYDGCWLVDYRDSI